MSAAACQDGTARILVERSAPTRRVPCLVVVQGREAGRVFALARGPLIVGRGAAAAIRLDDRGISRNHARVWSRAGRVEVEDLGSTNGVWWNGRRVSRVRLGDGDRLQLGACRLTFRWSQPDEGRLWRTLYQRATRDALTGLLNRVSLEDRLARELERQARYGHGLAVLVLDLDHFKQVNDAHGHAVGDRLLSAVGGALAEGLRASDGAARVGGEEFVVLLPECERSRAVATAEKLRRRLAELRVPLASGDELGVTVSVGVAVCSAPGTDAAGLLARADAACYLAKRAGRNRVWADEETLSCGSCE
jgi:diguanylate cyclase (GGDEF)-like protein